MIVVSDSTPLIHLAKVGNIELLFSLYKHVLITKEVYREVVEEGIILEKDDAEFVQEYVGKSIHVKSPKSSSDQLIEKYRIHKGEADSIQLAKEIGAQLILIIQKESAGFLDRTGYYNVCNRENTYKMNLSIQIKKRRNENRCSSR